MLYSGSKKKIAKYILPIILKGRTDKQWYVEPFCGGANTIDKVPGRRIGADVNEYLISFWQAIQRGWIPPSNISKEEYYHVKSNKEMYDNPVVCFTAVPCSFGAKWWGGYAFNSKGQNYAARAVRSITKQAQAIMSVIFVKSNYCNLYLPDNSIIYCDPPYANSVGYGVKFNHDPFWNWCRSIATSGHTIYISESVAPDDFTSVWETTVAVRTNKNTTGDTRKEKLFTYNE